MLRAEIAITRGDFDTAEADVTAAIEDLERYPAPLVGWKGHATRGRRYSSIGKSIVAEQACMAAATVARQIAEHVSAGGDASREMVRLGSELIKGVILASGRG